jgi:hypothetical protein
MTMRFPGPGVERTSATKGEAGGWWQERQSEHVTCHPGPFACALACASLRPRLPTFDYSPSVAYSSYGVNEYLGQIQLRYTTPASE